MAKTIQNVFTERLGTYYMNVNSNNLHPQFIKFKLSTIDLLNLAKAYNVKYTSRNRLTLDQLQVQTKLQLAKDFLYHGVLPEKIHASIHVNVQGAERITCLTFHTEHTTESEG